MTSNEFNEKVSNQFDFFLFIIEFEMYLTTLRYH